MWPLRQQGRIDTHTGPAAIVAEAAWGAPYIIANLHQEKRPLVWLELHPRDQGDAILQGNKLADAVERALGSPLFGYGMSYDYNLAVLETYLELLGPFTFALSEAQHAPELCRALLLLQRGENRLVLHFSYLPEDFSLPKTTLLLDTDTLALTEQEALALADARLPTEEVRALWQISNGAHETFLLGLHAQGVHPPPLRPGPEGPSAVPGIEPHATPELLLKALIQKGRYLEALELASAQVQDNVPKVLMASGEAFWIQGLEANIYPLLSNLPEPIRQQPRVLTYRLNAALVLGKEQEVLPEVGVALEKDDAPDLRALYAEGLFEQGDANSYLREAEQATRGKETPLTRYTYGRALGLRDPEAGLVQLERGLGLAETTGSSLTRILIAEAIASRHTSLGHYRAAVHWIEWGKKLYDQAALNQTARRLSLLNNGAFAYILRGGTAGLEESLKRELKNLDKVQPSLAELFQTTLADLFLSEGRAGEALAIYQELWRNNKRRERVGALANMLVRALLELGEVDVALAMAEQALSLTQGLEPLQQRRARLARGMALSFHDSEQATRVLEDLLPAFTEPMLADRLAQTGLYLARVYLLTGDPLKAQHTLTRAEAGLKELGNSGLRYLIGPPEAFQGVFALLDGDDPTIELSFLGRLEARVSNKSIALRPRLAELLTILALHPEGLTGEQLTLAVYGELGNVKRSKVELGRLRQLVPIKSRPYRIDISIRADFLRVRELIATGQMLEALELYKGPLLPQSDAPRITEMRIFLEESMRQAVLGARNAESLWVLAERLGDDLELWEEALASLGANDPRTAIARAQVRSLAESYGA